MATCEITRLDRSFVASFSDRLAELTETERLAWETAVVSRPEPVLRTIPIRSRGMDVPFVYLDNGEHRPTWFMSVLHGFANLVTLADNWDGEGASKIDKTTINRALAAIDRLLASDAPAPSIVPLSDSGLQIEWHRKQRDLEIEFTPNGRVEFYYFDEVTEEEHEGPVGPNFVNVEGYLERIR
ncbi:MAG: hypothetical protein HYR60_31555 [Acidobacteria bacterium]|nr:hypothetical protein [Acidobacteriota bacterium]